MTDANTTLFDIDASVLLAKLHVAAKDQVKTNNGMFIINTGIENPNDSAKPDNLGSVTFNLDNKLGEYQLGVAMLLSYQLKIDLKQLKNITKLQEDLKKAIEKESKEKEKASLTDKTDDKKSESLEIQKNLIKEYNNLVKGFKVKEFKVAEADLENGKITFEDAEKQFQENVKKENEHRVDEFQKNFKQLQNTGLEAIKTYFTIFSGPQNASKIAQTQVLAILGDADGKVKSTADFQTNIKNFQIDNKQILTNVEAYDKKIQETEPNKFVQRHIIFVVGYNVEL